MGVVPAHFFLGGKFGVLSNGLFGCHDFPLFLDEEEDGLRGSHLGGAFEILLQAEHPRIKGEFDLKPILVDFDINAYEFLLL